MNERSAKPRKHSAAKPDSQSYGATNNNSGNQPVTMPRKSSLLKQTLIALFLLVCFYTFFTSFIDPLTSTTSPTPSASSLAFANPDNVDTPTLRVFMYDLPEKFNHGIIKHHALARSSRVTDLSSLKYPGHQHMAEWYLYSDLSSAGSPRPGSPVLRVFDPAEADVFFVPVFSSLSLIVNPPRPANSEGSSPVYSDEEMQEDLVTWLEGQEHWRRNNGWDHVVIAQDPNALYKIIDRVKNAVLLVSDFGRLRKDQASLVKDIILPYSHRINTYEGDVGVEKRKTLLFFMGNRYRKEVLVFSCETSN